MTDDEIIHVLAEVGAEWLMDEADECCQSNAIRHIVASSIAAERESCAKLAEAVAKTMGDLARQHLEDGNADSMDRCYARALQCTQLAADIRTRSA